MRILFHRAVLLCWIGLAGCGYGFYAGGKLPGNVKNVHVSVFHNRTAETGLEQIFTNDLIYELMRDDSARLVDAAQADAILTGTISSIRVDSASRVNLQTTSKRSIVITGNLQLAAGKKIIWTSSDITVFDTYVVTPDAAQTERNKKEKLKGMSRRFAEKAYQMLAMDF